MTSRRTFLRSAAGMALTAGAGLLAASPATGATAPGRRPARRPTGGSPSLPEPRRRNRPRSPNGWPVDDAADAGGTVWSRPVPGTDFAVAVAIGEVEAVLVHVIRRFHYEIDELRPGDVIGFRELASVRGLELDHASGTAVDIRPGHHPVGARGAFRPDEVRVIRDILAECDGVVRWGGDERVPAEGHFRIDVPPGDPALERLAARLREGEDRPGRGAGVPRDVHDPRRRAAAERLARRQAR